MIEPLRDALRKDMARWTWWNTAQAVLGFTVGAFLASLWVR